jgi:hypothetical protein
MIKMGSFMRLKSQLCKAYCQTYKIVYLPMPQHIAGHDVKYDVMLVWFADLWPGY